MTTTTTTTTTSNIFWGLQNKDTGEILSVTYVSRREARLDKKVNERVVHIQLVLVS